MKHVLLLLALAGCPTDAQDLDAGTPAVAPDASPPPTARYLCLVNRHVHVTDPQTYGDNYVYPTAGPDELAGAMELAVRYNAPAFRDSQEGDIYVWCKPVRP